MSEDITLAAFQRRRYQMPAFNYFHVRADKPIIAIHLCSGKCCGCPKTNKNAKRIGLNISNKICEVCEDARRMFSIVATLIRLLSSSCNC